MSGLRPQHNSAFAFDTHLRTPQPDQGQVNTETHLTNKLSLQKTPERKSLGEVKRNLEIKAAVRDKNRKYYQKIKLYKYGMVDVRVYTRV